MKRILSKRVSDLFIACGIIVLFVPLAGKIYAEYNESNILPDQYQVEDPAEAPTSDNENLPAETLIGSLPDDTDKQESRSGASMPEEPQVTETALTEQPSKNENEPLKSAPPAQVKKPEIKQTLLGRIEIGKIKLNEAIVEGVRRVNLSAGIGHVPESADLGAEGNCVLAGHRNSTFKTFFRHLDQLEVGDQIKITAGDKTYVYTVYGKIVVSPDDVGVLKSVKGQYDLTLITCTPLYIASHRLIVFAGMTQ